MRERPILFSAPMVRAILEGRKTQTRRAVRHPRGSVFDIEDGWPVAECIDGETRPLPCPYGQPGDRLWVRERHHRTTDGSPVLLGYDVPGQNREFEVPGIGRVREFELHLGGWGGRISRNFPSIHMPRWASRITLEITDVRVQRLQEISEDDARAEGAEAAIVGADVDYLKYRAGFQSLWDHIHGAGDWTTNNPWVWVISFSRVAS